VSDGRWLALLAAGTLAIGGAACQRRGSRKTAAPSPKAVAKAVKASLSDDLRNQAKAGRIDCPVCGHCYVASEAAWHLLGGSDSGWVPASATWKGVTHWWLERDDGEILDVTAAQFPQGFPYDKGQRRGFLTGSEPSQRSQVVIERARKRLAQGSRAILGQQSRDGLVPVLYDPDTVEPMVMLEDRDGEARSGALYLERVVRPLAGGAIRLDNDCYPALERVIDRLFGGEIPPVYRVREISVDVRGAGHGQLLYEAALTGLARHHGRPVILTADACHSGGGTSSAAQRAWERMASDWFGALDFAEPGDWQDGWSYVLSSIRKGSRQREHEGGPLFVRDYVSPKERELSALERDTRAVAYGIKQRGPSGQRPRIMAGRRMAKLIATVSRPVLVPVPSSSGSTVVNRLLAEEIARHHRGATVADLLARTSAVQSSRARRQRGASSLAPQQHRMIRTQDPPAGRPVFLVDNVLTTGNTMEAARRALGGRGTPLVWAKHPGRDRRGSAYVDATVTDSGYHRTAIAASGASAPLKHLTKHHAGWVKGSVLDFGTGRGRDCAALSKRSGVSASCYDPHHPQAQRRQAPKGKHDLVTVFYVVNVLPPAERKKALKQAGALVKKGGRIAIAARGVGDSQGVSTAQGWTKHRDGHAEIVDGEIRRFQRFYDRDTLLRESLSALGRSAFVSEDSLVPMPADAALVVLRRI